MSDGEWEDFLVTEVTPRFPDGLSVADVTGQYRGSSGRAVIERSKHLRVVPPMGAMYALPRVITEGLKGFDDHKFAMELLERKHVLVVPGSSFNVPWTDHFRVTLLPDEDTLADVFGRIEELLDEWAKKGL